jgi:hypothetical protein
LRHRCGSLLVSHRSWQQHKRAEVVHIFSQLLLLLLQLPVPLSQPEKGKGWEARSSLIVVQPAAAPAKALEAVSHIVPDTRPLSTLRYLSWTASSPEPTIFYSLGEPSRKVGIAWRAKSSVEPTPPLSASASAKQQQPHVALRKGHSAKGEDQILGGSSLRANLAAVTSELRQQRLPLGRDSDTQRQG